MDTKDTAAFPADFGDCAFQTGLSKRELFALVAWHAMIKPELAHLTRDVEAVRRELVSTAAIRFADNLLSRLSDQSTPEG